MEQGVSMEQGVPISDRPGPGGTMGSGFLSLIGTSWASSAGFQRSLRRSRACFAAACLGSTFLAGARVI
jgi:hypothetical protein